MPELTANGAILHWEQIGSGDPVLLLNGLGAAASAWAPVLASLADGRRAIVFDHRGTGDSRGSLRWLRIASLADDAAAVADHVGGGRPVHVVGNSLGGMVAQEMAIRHPSLVATLTLCATGCGVPSIPSSPRLAWRLLRAQRSSGPERARWLVRAFHGPVVTEDDPAGYAALTASVGGSLPTEPGARAQLLAALRWGSLRRLHRITAPTLVLHGTHDLLVPPLNARILAARIPGARLTMLERSGHFFLTDAPGPAGDAIAAFLAAQDRSPRALGRVSVSGTLRWPQPVGSIALGVARP